MNGSGLFGSRKISLILLWVVFAILMVVIYLMALDACGFRLLFWQSGTCPRPGQIANPALESETRRQSMLMAEVERLELALLERPICTPEPPQEPEPELQPEPEIPQEPKPEPDPEPEQAESPLEPCPPDRRRTTEVVLLLDTSGSMNFDFALDPAIEDEIQQLQQSGGAEMLFAQLFNNPNADPMAQILGGVLGGMLNVSPARQKRLRELQELVDQPHLPNRIDIARSSLTKLVQTSAEEVEFTFIDFNKCNQPLNSRRYGSGQRGALLRDIAGSQADNATALARTIAQLPGEIAGGRSPEEPVNIVLVSDGRDSCEGDPCASAANLKRQVPHAFVNAIAISRDSSQAQCIANATGGTFVAADDAESLAELLVQAAGQDLPEHCQ